MEGSALTHLDASGRARMVDVSEKAATERYARARAVVRMSPHAAGRVAAGDNPKGDVAAVARIAAIQAAKRTDELIPLAHSLPLTHVAPEIAIDPEAGTVTVVAEARTMSSGGVAAAPGANFSAGESRNHAYHTAAQQRPRTANTKNDARHPQRIWIGTTSSGAIAPPIWLAIRSTPDIRAR